jgi:hypothetical protein
MTILKYVVENFITPLDHQAWFNEDFEYKDLSFYTKFAKHELHKYKLDR